MGKRFFLSLALLIASILGANAQEYVNTPVTVSKEKVRLDGKIYYSHVVLERQTLYSISKAYEVSIEDIYKANENINLRETGLKKNSIILIPTNQANNKGKGRDKKKDEPVVEEPAEQEPAAVETAQNAASEESRKDEDHSYIEGFGAVDEMDTVAVETPEVEEPSFEPKSNVNVMLMLPLKAASGRGSSGYMDFYSGALLAARAKGIQGISVNLSVYDVANGLPRISKSEYEETDVIIGPVFYDNAKALLDIVPEETVVVSPMDARTDVLVEGHKNFIQAHGASSEQYGDLVSWMEKEYAEGEQIVVISEKGREKDMTPVTNLLTDKGFTFSTLSYNILEGRNVDQTLKARMDAGKINRVFVVSESEAFVNDVMRNLNLLSLPSSGSYTIALYGPSKIKTFETIEAENFHSTNLHLALAYNVNYDDARVKDFLLKYRAVFKTEPTAFAYQGYDLVYFFVSEVAKYGDNWSEWFTQDSTSLLQTDFKFEKAGDEDGFTNKSLRHIIYGPDYSVETVNL